MSKSRARPKKKKLGRPVVVLPSFSAEAHEARRLTLGLSKRAYAKSISVPQATYIKKTQHVRAPRKPHAQKQNGDKDFLLAAREFMALKPKYAASLRTELKLAEAAVIEAKTRVKAIKRALSWF